MTIEAIEAHGISLRNGKLWGLAGVITELGRHSDWRGAWELLQLSMRWQTWSPKVTKGPDAVAFNAAVTALGHSSWMQSLAVLDLMKTSLVEPTALTFGGLLGTLGKGAELSHQGAWLRTIHILGHLESEHSHSSHVIMFNTAITTCRFRHWPFGLHLLAKALESGLEVDIVSWNSILLVSGQRGWEYSVAALQEIQDSKMVPDTISTNSCIKSCAEGHSWRKVLHLSRHEGKLRGSNVPGFNVAINGLATVLKWQEAPSFIHQVDECCNFVILGWGVVRCMRLCMIKYLVCVAGGVSTSPLVEISVYTTFRILLSRIPPMC